MVSKADFVCDTAGCFLNVRIRGEIDHHTAVEIRNGIDAVLFAKRPRRLNLDMSSVSFMDSSGLGLIMGRLSVMKELGGDLVLCDPSAEIRNILTLAGMERIVKIEYSAVTPPEPRAKAVRRTRKRVKNTERKSLTS